MSTANDTTSATRAITPRSRHRDRRQGEDAGQQRHRNLFRSTSVTEYWE
ncbi:hypothetical protein SCALM49S_00987 [Streptomyces californicus]